MKRNRWIMVIVWVSFISGIITCCLGRGEESASIRPEQFMGAGDAEIEHGEAEAMNMEVAGTKGVIVMAGSTAMEKLANILAEGFMKACPDVTVTAEFTGSSAGIESVLAGRADIGNISRSLREEEQNAGAVETVVAVDGIAVITHSDNRVSNLASGQLADIYMGKIRNWREVGGADAAIVVVGREAGSGTRSTFEEILHVKDVCAYANEMDSSGAVMARVAATPGSIGYVSADIPDDTVRILALDGKLPTKRQIQSGSYCMSRPFVMVTDGEVSRQSAAVQAFFAYIQSAEGRRLIESIGLVTVTSDSNEQKKIP